LDQERFDQGETVLSLPWHLILTFALQANSRWLVPSLQPIIRSLKEARENRNAATKKFKFRLFGEFDKDRGVWLRAIRVLAELDCLFSLAKSSNAIGDPACRPEFVEGESAFVEFEDLRHPALDLRNGNFIPNNVQLGGDVGKIALLTGEFGIASGCRIAS
jgi:DNA mismatch repair protein MSH6